MEIGRVGPVFYRRINGRLSILLQTQEKVMILLRHIQEVECSVKLSSYPPSTSPPFSPPRIPLLTPHFVHSSSLARPLPALINPKHSRLHILLRHILHIDEMYQQLVLWIFCMITFEPEVGTRCPTGDEGSEWEVEFVISDVIAL